MRGLTIRIDPINSREYNLDIERLLSFIQIKIKTFRSIERMLMGRLRNCRISL